MSDSCTTGLTYLFHCYEETHTEIYNAIAEDAYRSTSKDGMVGEPLPYQLRSDWMVTSLMFICFVLASYVLMRSSKYIQSQFSFFFSNKDRYGLFDNNTSSDVRYALILLSQTVLFSGFCLYDFFSTYDKFLFASVPHVYLLLLFIIVIALFILIKWAVYMFINWIFFCKTKQKLWISSFSSVIIWSGFLLFPIVFLIGKIFLFYKCFSNFFNKFYGILHLILYFCALEVIPDLILWKSILLANNSLVLNF